MKNEKIINILVIINPVIMLADNRLQFCNSLSERCNQPHGVYQCYDLEGFLGRVFAKATNVNVKILTIDNKLVETFTISAIGFTRAVNDLFDEEEM